MSAKHTPGPWVPNPLMLDQICTYGGEPTVVAYAYRDMPADIVIANANLIAAAPDLLEACQTFAEWLRREEAGFPAETRFNTTDGEAKWREWFDENFRICDLAQKQARAAIAKATGSAE